MKSEKREESAKKATAYIGTVCASHRGFVVGDDEATRRSMIGSPARARQFVS